MNTQLKYITKLLFKDMLLKANPKTLITKLIINSLAFGLWIANFVNLAIHVLYIKPEFTLLSWLYIILMIVSLYMSILCLERLGYAFDMYLLRQELLDESLKKDISENLIK
jgi:hypothetical protein